MTESEFKKLVKSNKYQAFLFTCPAMIPFVFAVHPWFVVNKKGKISRWEVLFRKDLDNHNWGHLYLDFLPPYKGIEIIPLYKKYFWKGKMVGFIEGDKGSLAQKMADFIEKSYEKYPYKEKYSFFGPNSNTYAKWVLKHFPESRLKLPINAIG